MGGGFTKLCPWFTGMGGGYLPLPGTGQCFLSTSSTSSGCMGGGCTKCRAWFTGMGCLLPPSARYRAGCSRDSGGGIAKHCSWCPGMGGATSLCWVRDSVITAAAAVGALLSTVPGVLVWVA